MSAYTGSCVCGKAYDNNCAHYLSNWMIENKTLNKSPSGCHCCAQGRPLRAKEMRDVFIAMGKTKTFNAPKGNCFIYCENSGQGHVYYGTKGSAEAGWTWDAATYYEYYV